MSTAVKNDPILWDKVVKRLKNSDRGGATGTWNARKAQLAVTEYKNLGGKYKSRKDEKNSLAIWTAESWGYIDGKKGNRYLPKSVRDKLSRSEAREENRRKKSATKKGVVRAKYSRSVAAKVRRSRLSVVKSRKSRKK